MKITFTDFKGTAPKLDPLQLADGYASVSTNTKPGRGLLESWRAPEAIAGGTLVNANQLSIFKYNTVWFSWTTAGVHAVRVPVANDPYDYVVIADPSTYPQITENTIAESGVGPYPASTLRIGVPSPPTPTITAVEDNSLWVAPDPFPQEDEFDVSETSYILLYEDAWGRVGPASLASPQVTLREYKFENTYQVRVNIPPADAALLVTDVGRGTTAQVRIYRANYSANGQGVFQYVGQIAASGGSTEFIDRIYSGDLQDGVTTTDWVGPPDDDTALFPNGTTKKFVIVGDFIAGHNDRLVCFSEPNTAHAFPARYYKVFKEKVITIATMGADLVVLTDDYPYILTGVHPEAISVQRLADPAPCTSAMGVTEINDSIYFVSSTGLFEIQGGRVRNVIEPFMREQEWQALDPTDMMLSNYDGRLFIHCTAQSYTLVFDPRNPADGLRQVAINPQATYQLEETNDLVYVNNTSSAIEKFDSNNASRMVLTWISKEYEVHTPICPVVAKVDANNYPLDVIFAYETLDGTEVSYTKTVTDSRFFYLPFEKLGRKIWVRCSATSGNNVEIRNIQVGNSLQEFS